MLEYDPSRTDATRGGRPEAESHPVVVLPHPIPVVSMLLSRLAAWRLSWTACAIVLAACTGGDAEKGAAPSTSGVGATVDAARDRETRPWVVTHDGYGPLRAGMSVGTARTALDGEFALADSTASCQHVAVDGAPGRVLAMVVDGRVARVEVADGSVSTDRGARVGDTEARIDSLYRGEVTAEPHKYTDGRYLVVRPTSAADSGYRLIFETDGARVVTYRAGLRPEVEWVEGCG